MKLKALMFVCACITLASCNQKAGNEQNVTNTTDTVAKTNELKIDLVEPPHVDTVAVICQELKKYLQGKNSNVVIARSAERDLYESTWPEAQCPASYSEDGCPFEDECGPLFGTSDGTSLKVSKYGKDKYIYSVICPCGCGQRFKDFTYMEAHLRDDGKVEITHVVWI